MERKYKAKEISVVEAVKASIAQIEKVEKDVNSFVTLDKEALKRAEEVQKLIDDRKTDRTTCRCAGSNQR